MENPNQLLKRVDLRAFSTLVWVVLSQASRATIVFSDLIREWALVVKVYLSLKIPCCLVPSLENPASQTFPVQG
jgi:hypothetical protein